MLSTAKPPPAALDAHWRALLARLSGVLDLDRSARASGALLRRRAVADAATLLRLALAHGPGGLSLRSAAAWAAASGVASLSDVALRRRIRGAADWLGEVAAALLREPPPAPGAGGGADDGSPRPRRRLCIADGTTFGHPRAPGIVWRLHAGYDPSAARFTDLALTDARGPEGFARLRLGPGDVAVGDRGYAKPTGLRHVLGQGADFVVRVGWASLALAGPDGRPVDWGRIHAGLAPGEAAEHPVTVTSPSKGTRRRRRPLFAARLVVLRHADPRTAERGTRALLRSRKEGRHRRQVAQPLTFASTGYLMLLTSLPQEAADARGVLALYRLRWQVELAFRRLKGGLGMDRLLARDERAARGWLLSHLILALLVEDAAGEVLDAAPVRLAGTGRPVSLWRLHGALRRALLAAVLRPAAPSALARAAALVVRHICDPPRRRRSQAAWALFSPLPGWPGGRRGVASGLVAAGGHGVP